MKKKIPILRLSVTQRCNFKCIYCDTNGQRWGEGYPFGDGEMDQEDILSIVKIFVGLGVDKVRITGGEPLLRKNILELIEKIKRIPRVKELTLATNGSHLEEYASDLKYNGLDAIAVSLDAADPDIFKSITNFPLYENIINGIYEVMRVKLPLRINMVVIRGINDSEVERMIHFTSSIGATLKLLDLIKIKNEEFWKKNYLPLTKLKISKLGGVKPISNAHLFATPKGLGIPMKVYYTKNEKLILQDSMMGTTYNKDLCYSCPHFPCQSGLYAIRVTNDGMLKPCLLRNDNLIDALKIINSRDYSLEDTQIFKNLLSLYQHAQFKRMWRYV